MVKIQTIFPDISSETLYDVLHDPDYRKVWDTHMLESLEIGLLNVNNDVGYYAMSCPPPLKPRDFVLQRSWLDTGPNGEQMLLSRSIPHKDFPPKKGYVRAITHITGFVLRSRLPETGCVLNYVAQCDPQGKLPPWLVNKVTHTLGPRMVKDLRKAALGYIEWKQNQSHFRKPWRDPEDITVPRILITDCWDPVEPVTEMSTPSAPSTPTLHSKPLKISSSKSNGSSLPCSVTNSPIVQKKSKKKFKFKFDNFNDSLVREAMQYKVSIPNERDLHCEEECAKVKSKWKKLNVYQHLASVILIPTVIVAFWRGTWDLQDHFHQFFPVIPTLIASLLAVSILELLRNSFIVKHLRILDDDSSFKVFKKNVLLSLYDIIYNLANVVAWRILWGHPEVEEFKLKENFIKKKFLNILDSLISLFVISPLVVGFWRGLWSNIENYDLHYGIFPIWQSFVVSLTVVILIYYCRPTLNVMIENKKNFKKINRRVTYRIFQYIFALSCIMVWRCTWEIVPILYVISYWRGTWEFMNLYPEIFPGMNCMIVGAIMHLCLALLREPLNGKYNSYTRSQKKSFISSCNLCIVKKIYTFVFSLGCIMHWRGGWSVMEDYLGPELIPAIIVSVVCFIPLILMRAVRNLVAPPMVIITDSKEFAFNFPTRYRIDIEIFIVFDKINERDRGRKKEREGTERSVKLRKKRFCGIEIAIAFE
ncbi:CLUMA_CG007896, isoform B [Clunio marinus]|uniref:CLUMA_CG007896, isoform B n=1 Tax=Clunio marinus TaxID=568069 RepID=A0A1J1I269_9DIPT|nr:CLUMA_CG007896, isoform B [Clunio marinus]